MAFSHNITPMQVYRITRERFAQDLSGEGAKRYGGRWNREGTPLLYTASSRALALVETLIHLPKNYFPKDLMLVTIDLGNFKSKNSDKLPSNWKELPTPYSTQQWGSNWCKTDKIAIQVPSIAIPEEWNVILNPLATNFIKTVTIEEARPFYFDSRLVSK